ncbi:hypothetical protein [Sinomonas mesophila]|uniref:hypothetical protein n=1 Tax=Sinomonas mesophila TaxID=1531955 RepID=UPI0009870526|nr:hypothetical protein [Sinomonas mesophila]
MYAHKILGAAAGAAALVLLSAVPAAADIASPNASCAGLALSDHAVSDGPGAIAFIMNEELKPAAEAFGFSNSGQLISKLVKVHAGTHIPGCEDAFIDILLTGP